MLCLLTLSPVYPLTHNLPWDSWAPPRATNLTWPPIWAHRPIALLGLDSWQLAPPLPSLQLLIDSSYTPVPKVPMRGRGRLWVCWVNISWFKLWETPVLKAIIIESLKAIIINFTILTSFIYSSIPMFSQLHPSNAPQQCSKGLWTVHSVSDWVQALHCPLYVWL